MLLFLLAVAAFQLQKLLLAFNTLDLRAYNYMLWFKFILGLKFFELVSILFAIVPDYGNEYRTKENKN